GEKLKGVTAKVSKIALKTLVILGLVLTLGAPLLSKSVRAFVSNLFKKSPPLEQESTESPPAKAPQKTNVIVPGMEDSNVIVPHVKDPNAIVPHVNEPNQIVPHVNDPNAIFSVITAYSTQNLALSLFKFGL